MNRNLYFSAVSIVLQIVILRFYDQQPVLPVRKNKLFKRILIVTMVTTLLNYFSMHIDMIPGSSYSVLVSICATVYYSLYEYLFYMLFTYGMDSLGYTNRLKNRMFLYKLPLYLLLLIVFISNWTHTIFYINSDGYFTYGKYFLITFFVPFVYSVILYKSRPKVLNQDKRHLIRIYQSCLVLIFVGMVVDYWMVDLLIFDTVIAIAELILYLSMENPDFFNSHITKTYNTEAFMLVVNEALEEKKEFYLSGIGIKNYASLRSHHGSRNLYLSMREFGAWFIKEFPDAYVFYPDNECFVLATRTPLTGEQLLEKAKSRLETPFIQENIEMFFRGIVFDFESLNNFNSASDILNVMRYMFENDAVDAYNEVHHIGEAEYTRLQKEKKLCGVLQQHIKDNDIDVFYQPLYSTKTKMIEGAEALVRINDKNYGLIPPNDFIPLAEKTGEIIELGMLVFDRVCQYVSSHDLSALGLKFINVNLSAVQFQDMNLASNLEKTAMKYGLDLSIFDFEITETGITNDQLIEYQFNRLIEKGAHISLDDFGSGNSNLERLVRFPFDVSKLDMSLVWNYFKGVNTIMEDVIHIFKNENQKIVAEGVETKEMVERLTAMQCEYLQGYYFSKPLPEEDFTNFVMKFNQI